MESNNASSELAVFIVEDSSLVIARLELMLAEFPFVKLAGKAGNLESAIMGINLTHPKIVIIDIHLKDDAPDSNGMDLLQILKKHHPGIVLIMLTNMSSPQYREKCLANGADYFLDKSIDFQKISEIISSIKL